MSSYVDKDISSLDKGFRVKRVLYAQKSDFLILLNKNIGKGRESIEPSERILGTGPVTSINALMFACLAKFP